MEVHREPSEGPSRKIGHSRAGAFHRAQVEVPGTPKPNYVSILDISSRECLSLPARSLESLLPVCWMEPPAQDAGVYALALFDFVLWSCVDELGLVTKGEVCFRSSCIVRRFVGVNLVSTPNLMAQSRHYRRLATIRLKRPRRQ